MTNLAELAERHSLPPSHGGGDKGHPHTYIPVYERHLTRVDNIALLEIGIWQGHSIRMWNEYFTNSTIHGIDINLDRLTTPINGVMRCDATDRQQCDTTLGDNTYDYIIDDASHQTQHIIDAWANLHHRLRPGGKYFIEDLQPEQVQPILLAINPTRHEIHQDWDIMLIITA